MDGSGWKIKEGFGPYKMPIEYEKDIALFSLKIHHAGKIICVKNRRRYVNGLVSYVEWVDIDRFSVQELNVVMWELGYVKQEPIYYHYMIPGTDLDVGLRALGNDQDVIGLAKYIPNNKLIIVYCEHLESVVDTYAFPPPSSSVVIEEINPCLIPRNVLYLTYPNQHSSTSTHTPSTKQPSSSITTPSPHQPSSSTPTPSPQQHVTSTPTLSNNESLPTHHETVETIYEELLNMEYEFDPFDDIAVNEAESDRVVNEPQIDRVVNEAESDRVVNEPQIDRVVNEAESDRVVVNNEPTETLFEGQTMVGDEEGSSTENDYSDSEDDEDYFVDEDTFLEEVNVDMDDYHFNIDADVEWVRHDKEAQVVTELDPSKVNVIDNDQFDSGTDSECERIEHIRRKKLREVKKANESENDTVFKHFFYVGQCFSSANVVKERVKLHSIETRRNLWLAKNDKQRIRAKCVGKNLVFLLEGEGASNTEDVGASGKGQTDFGPNKKVGKGKTDVSASGKGQTDVGPNKKVGGRGRPKPLAPDECPWALQVTKVKNTESWEVRTYNNVHTCLQTRIVSACTSKFLSKGIIDQVEKNPNIPLRALQDELQKKYELGVSIQKAGRAKTAAVNQVKGDYKHQYTMLRDYCLELRRANPDTTVRIEVERDATTDDNTRIFKRIYVCLGPLKKGFRSCGRELLGLDGAFMKGPYPGQLLTAIGLDANNGIYPLAYAIVEKETTCSWTWFLECLGDDLGLIKESNFTFISDRQKGLSIAIANVFPCAEHRYCLRHIHENMKKQWSGLAYKEHLWRCASATTVPYFDTAMEALKEFDKGAFEWLAKIPAHSWARSHFSGRAKSDILLNNLCECFNGKILDAIAVIKKSDGPLTPAATKLLSVAIERANRYTVGYNGGEEYEVKSMYGTQCVVNVVKKVCSCRKWELTGIPCAHAIAASFNMSLNGHHVNIQKEWVDKCYWLATWEKTYSYTLGCLNGKVMWQKSQITTTLTLPKHNTPVGRPRKNRRKTRDEKAQMVKDGRLSGAYKTVTCVSCGNKGHNKRSCKGQQDPNTARGSSAAGSSAPATGSRSNASAATGSSAPIRAKKKTPSDAAGSSAPATAKKKRKSDAAGSSAPARKKQAPNSKKN